MWLANTRVILISFQEFKSNPELAAFIVRIFPVEDVLNDLGFFISNFYNTGFEKRYVAHY
jgi:hypothetical protein